MGELGLCMMMIAVLIGNLPALTRQWHDDRPGVIRTLWMAGIYLVYVGLGTWGLFLLVPEGGSNENAPILAVFAMLGYILYGVLVLMRHVPRYREPPRWLMHFGVADMLILLLLFGSLAAFLWA